MTPSSDIAIIGAGIVGLATAWQLLELEPSLRLVVIDKERGVARHQTSHNSGVIHSGIYYTPGSGKAVLCREGVSRMVDFAREQGLAHDICGKLIVATTEEEIPRLRGIQARGIENGLDGLRWLDPTEAREIEPHVQCLAAVHVPQTGIIDYGSVAERLHQLLLAKGVVFRLGESIRSITEQRDGVTIHTEQGEVTCQTLVACTGLWADHVARMAGLTPDVHIVPFRGEYYKLSPKAASLVRHLIYPVPDPAFPFLGVHFTRMIRGGVEAGPNAVLALKREGYHRTDLSLTDTAEILAYPGFRKIAARYWRTGLAEQWRSWNKSAYLRTLQRLIPNLTARDLMPGGSGVRAQALRPDGSLVDDFDFLETEWMIHVLNAPSPAATASLAIGDRIARKAIRHFIPAPLPNS